MVFSADMHPDDVRFTAELLAESLKYLLVEKGGPSGKETQGIFLKGKGHDYIVSVGPKRDDILLMKSDLNMPHGTLVWVGQDNSVTVNLSASHTRLIQVGLYS